MLGSRRTPGERVGSNPVWWVRIPPHPLNADSEGHVGFVRAEGPRPYPNSKKRACPKTPAQSPPTKWVAMATLVRSRSLIPSIIPT